MLDVTGHLDRCESGSAAMDIMSASLEYPSASHAPLSSFSLSGVAGRYQQGFGCDINHRAWNDMVLPLRVEALRTNLADSVFHVVVFDTEALITILSSRATSLPSGVALISTDSHAQLKVATAGSGSPKKAHIDKGNPAVDEFRRYLAARRVMGSAKAGSGSVEPSHKQLPSPQQRKQKRREQRRAEKILSGKGTGGVRVRERAFTLGMGSMEGGLMNYTHNVARLLLSCLHAWNLDKSMDECCCDVLGLAKPKEKLSLGLVSGDHLSLLLPGLHRIGCSDSEDLTSMTADHTAAVASEGSLVPEGRLYEHQWQVSSSVTTKLLLVVVSLANTLMSYVTTDRDGQGPKSPLVAPDPLSSAQWFVLIQKR